MCRKCTCQETGKGNNMENKPINSVEHEVEKEIRRYRPLESLFLVDILRDRDSRPAFLWALTTLLVGTIFYHWAEGWSYLDSLYFCVVSLATVGYGDLTPTTPIAKLFTIAYLINGIAILLALFDRIRMVRSQRIEKLVERRKES
jgi:voltage-gated potassium channel